MTASSWRRTSWWKRPWVECATAIAISLAAAACGTSTSKAGATSPEVVQDGEGGVFVAWVHRQRPEDRPAIRCIRVGPSGKPAWEQGVDLHEDATGFSWPQIVPQPSGGIVSYAHASGGHRVVRVAPSGALTDSWTIEPSPSTYLTSYVGLARSDSGGAFVLWDPNASNVYRCQRLDDKLSPKWDDKGRGIDDPGLGFIGMAPDAQGGVIVGWVGRRSDESVHLVQRLDAEGTALWDSGGVFVGDHSSPVPTLALEHDGLGGAIVACANNRLAGGGVSVQRIGSKGGPVWPPGGVTVGPGDVLDPAIVPDGQGGGFILWQLVNDAKSSGLQIVCEIRAQHVGPDGTPTWTKDGLRVAEIALESDTRAVSDGQEGFVVTWAERGREVYAQRVNARGERVWGERGTLVSSGSGKRGRPAIASDGRGGAFVAWEEERSGKSHVYLAHVTSDGRAGAAGDVQDAE